MGKHRKRRSKYVGRHRATASYVEYQHLGKKATGVLALSTVLSLTPAMLGYEVVENEFGSMSSVPPDLLEEIWGEVVPDPAPEPAPVELDAP